MNELPLNSSMLKDLKRLSFHYNIAPIFLPQYYYENNHPISKILQEIVNEAYNYLAILSDAEIEAIKHKLPQGLLCFINKYQNDARSEYLRRFALYYVVAKINRLYFTYKDVISCDHSDSEVLKVYPELENKLDKDGLLHIDDIFILHDGGIEYKEHMLHYHQFLRRGYSSNPNFNFTGSLLEYYAKTKLVNKFHIAIDHRRIMPKNYYSKIIEYDAWFGPSFNPKTIDDPNSIGLTTMKRNKNSLFELENQLDRTEFFWSYKDRIKTFEIEEVSDMAYVFENYNINKYIHSERDIDRKIFRHLDGAVKVYISDTYEDRFKSFTPKEPKAHKKIKLWRIDGEIELRQLVNLISFFYKGNEMIIEYFNPDEFTKFFELRVRDPETWKKQQGENI
jgi:hypothetical protein